MEDPDEEWEIEEYSVPKDSGSNVRWILSKGLSLGKKVVVIGIVISSAPLVLPPLMVFSTLGFALSVPFGLYFATYAFTQKLMSKLLSLPQPPDPLMLEYWDEEEDIEEDLTFEGRMDMEEEEEMKDTKEGIEMRIELPDMENEGIEAGERIVEGDYEQGSADLKKPEAEEDLNKIEKEGGYEEDENGKPLNDVDMRSEEPLMVESMNKKPVEVVRGVEIVIELDEELGGSIEVGEPFGVSMAANEENKGSYTSKDVEEGKKLVKETRGLTERIRDEGIESAGPVEQPVKQTQGAAEEKDEKNVGNVKKMESPVGDRNLIETPRPEKPNPKKEKVVKKKGFGILKENEKKKGRRNKGNNDIIPKVGKPVENTEGALKRNVDESKDDNIVEVEMPQGETKETINSRSIVGEEQKPTVDKTAVLERTDDNIVNDADKDVQLGRKKDTAILSNAAIRKTEEIKLTQSAATENNHVSSGVPKSSSEEATTMPSKEGLYGEDKIWERIGALRAIVGYRVARQVTCVEELKALYIFTGVEPPALFKDPTDLADVNDKLRFLMSIVGVM